MEITEFQSKYTYLALSDKFHLIFTGWEFDARNIHGLLFLLESIKGLENGIK